MRFAVITICLALAWRFASHDGLRRYFASNLVVGLILEACLLRWPYNSIPYTVLWISGCLIIYWFELSLMWNAICFVPVRSLILLPSLGMAALLVWNSHPRGLFEWTGHVNASADLFCAIPAGVGAAYLHGTPRKIALSLSFLWLAQSLYGFGWGLHLSNPDWVILNNWLPTFLTAAGSLWLSFLAHQYTQSDLPE